MGLEVSAYTVLLSDLGFVPCLSELICDGAGQGDPLALSRHHRSTPGKACSLPFPARPPWLLYVLCSFGVSGR